VGWLDQLLPDVVVVLPGNRARLAAPKVGDVDGPEQGSRRPLLSLADARVPLDGCRLHVAQVRLQELGVVAVEASVVDKLGEQDAIAWLVDTLLLRMEQEHVENAA